MCEPTHSIVQYPTVVEGEPIGHLVQAAIERPETKGLLLPTGSLIYGYLNYSSLGFGHSEAVGRLPYHVRSRLPEDMKYEAKWWDRTVRRDWGWDAPGYIDPNSYESAETYAQRSSIGSLPILRRFLEQTLMKTFRPSSYVSPFLEILNDNGQSALRESISKIFSGKNINNQYTLSTLLESEKKEKVIGMMLKTTRNPRNLRDVWASV